MKRYVVKNEKNKTYKNMFGVTDYDIPMFGFKSALLILGATMLSLIVCVNGFHYLHIDSVLNLSLLLHHIRIHSSTSE